MNKLLLLQGLSSGFIVYTSRFLGIPTKFLETIIAIEAFFAQSIFRVTSKLCSSRHDNTRRKSDF